MELKESSEAMKPGCLCLYAGLSVLVIEIISQSNHDKIKTSSLKNLIVLFPNGTFDIVREDSLIINQL